MSVFMIAQAGTQTPNDILADWQGTFINRSFVNEKTEMDTVYRKVAVEAQKQGKQYTAGQVKQYFREMGPTSFDKLSITGDTIRFYNKGGNEVTHQYKALGTVPDIYGDYKFEWYAFQAKEKGVEDSEYRYVILLKIHEHKNGQPHFHIRYGNKGVKELTGLGGMKNWWPTMVRPDFDIPTYINNVNPKMMVKVLP